MTSKEAAIKAMILMKDFSEKMGDCIPALKLVWQHRFQTMVNLVDQNLEDIHAAFDNQFGSKESTSIQKEPIVTDRNAPDKVTSISAAKPKKKLELD